MNNAFISFDKDNPIIYYNGAIYDEKETKIIENRGGENEIFKNQFIDIFDHSVGFSIPKNIYLGKNLTKIGCTQPEKINFEIFIEFNVSRIQGAPYFENR